MSRELLPSASGPPRWNRKRRVAAILIGLVVLAAGVWAADWVLYRFTHSISRDAFIESHLINVAPQVAGDVVEVHVQEQSLVRKGQLLAVVDPTPYRREVNLARARHAVAQAALEKAEADLALLTEEVPRRITIAELKLAVAREDETKAVDSLEMITRDVEKAVAAAESAVKGAKATFVLAEQDYERYSDLYRDGSTTQRKFQEATKILKTARAEVEIAEARLAQAEANRKQIGIATQQLRSARHAVGEAKAALELARLGTLQIEAGRRLVAERRRAVDEARRTLELAQTNLDYTRVQAPYDGVIARKWRHLGDYAAKGEPIFSMYNPELLYVTVNLEETRLQGVAPGNWARLDVDAFDRPFRGRVLWVGSATDAKFSLIPRDVSAGEFTKVVQRVPTRIWIERDERWPQLKPGLSVTAAIEHGPGDPDWAAEALRQEAEIAGIEGAKP
jgi:membrane fusion protein (multidrug efflux system)